MLNVNTHSIYTLKKEMCPITIIHTIILHTLTHTINSIDMLSIRTKTNCIHNNNNNITDNQTISCCKIVFLILNFYSSQTKKHTYTHLFAHSLTKIAQPTKWEKQSTIFFKQNVKTIGIVTKLHWYLYNFYHFTVIFLSQIRNWMW